MMIRTVRSAIVCALLCAPAGAMVMQQYLGRAQKARWQPEKVREAVAGWPAPSRLAAERMMEEYGAPTGVDAERLAWSGRGPWQWIIVKRAGAVEQCVRYAVPDDRIGDLAALRLGVGAVPEYSLLYVSSESEEMNILALNVAVDVLDGARTVAEARAFYDRTRELTASGKASPYTRALLFSPPAERTQGP